MKHLILFLALTFAAPAAVAAPTDFETSGDETMHYKDTTIEACAQAAHEANRAYCTALGDTSQVPWDQAPEWQRESCRVGVRGVLNDGNTPEQSHELWLAHKAADGWVYGPVKDPSKKTHPCFVPYGELPPEQRQKDRLFVTTVLVVSSALEPVPAPAIEPIFEPSSEAEATQVEPQLYGQIGYQAYATATGGKTFDGRDMPQWEALPERIQQAWGAAARSIRAAQAAAVLA